MAKKMLGKVVAGAALGGASLLVFAPGVAFADGQPHKDEGKVFAKPHAAKPGEEIKLVEICEQPQENAFVWSKVTGKVKLEPAHDGKKSDHGGWKGEDGSYEHGKDGKDWKSEDEHGKDKKDWKSEDEYDKDKKDWKSEDEYDKDKKDWKSEDEHDKDKKDWKSEDEHGEDKKDWKSGDERGEEKKDWKSGDEERGEWQGREDAAQDGAGGGAAADGDHDWKGREDDKRDEKSEHGGKDRDEYGAEERDWRGDEKGKDDRWEHEKDFVYFGEARIAKDAKPGTYKLEGSCGEGELVVLPHGGVDGGDGGLTAAADSGLATAGASLVGAAALGGLVLLRRRRTDEFAV
ncbi:hypothetical protein E0H26_18290 [Micromonospora zingiberis]|uniref:LPXTG cell wall anchor domain-containing protein n=1 Tax=Micromonospora zingiberis TaxID=2053011 RepID=A0A4V2LWA0_9ACTN|nr:hypothetical protein [Micromonospora zingiberis]TCB95755.1 hypothetical protein E0H26_18290 [Micromonospora zingiberis]